MPAIAALTDPTSPAAEAYRSLRTSLQFARQDSARLDPDRQGTELRTFLVSSPSAGEGKSTTVANLGAVFAQAGERVVIVSCDLRRPWPRPAGSPGPDDPAGLPAVLAGQRPLDEALVPVPGTEGLWAVSTWTVPPNPTELLSGQRMRDAFTELTERFDVVLIDSPPVLPVADAMILTAYADAVLLVVAAGKTMRGELHRTAEKLAQASVPVIGVVLNKATAQDGYGGYQPYAYTTHATAAPRRGGRARVTAGRDASGRHQR
jgi:capsular exopolysaccharide synthesis family protein